MRRVFGSLWRLLFTSPSSITRLRLPIVFAEHEKRCQQKKSQICLWQLCRKKMSPRYTCTLRCTTILQSAWNPVQLYGHINKYHCFSGNRACQFPPVRQFWSFDSLFFPQRMHIYLRSQCLTLTFRYL